MNPEWWLDRARDAAEDAHHRAVDGPLVTEPLTPDEQERDRDFADRAADRYGRLS